MSLLVLGIALTGDAAARTDCTGILPGPIPVARALRPVTATDLVRLRDIGAPDAANPDIPSPLAVSPDGRSVAFVVTRADPVTNAYCRALIVQPLERGVTARIIDRGGDYRMTEIPVRGLLSPIGPPATVTPAWSPDGRSIAYLKRLGGRTDIWLARADGSGAVQITRSKADIESLLWPAAGPLLYAARPGRALAAVRIDSEGRSGWLYDARIRPNLSARPQIRAADAPLMIYALDPATGAATPAAPEHRAAWSQAVAAWSGAAVMSPDGWHGAFAATGPSPFSPHQLVATDPEGRELRCEAPACRGRLSALWYEGGTIRFQRREGWHNERTGFYAWRPGRAAPQRILVTNDVIQGCVPARDELVCLRENATTPRQIVMVAPAAGKVRTLFDPNPEFRHIELGNVTRLKWRNDRGFEAWGDLVLPPGRQPGVRLPLVIVQYHSRGFLRGGTNDDYPIYLLAARGFAVLSLERPTAVASLDPKLATSEAMIAANQKDWAEHRSLYSSLMAGVDAAIATGAVDPARIGITGLSDGATLTRFALIHSRRFAAAAISTCCVEGRTAMTYGGIALAEANAQMGYPPTIRPDPAFWAPMSLAQNAMRIDTPLLLQLADSEYLLALEVFQALREASKPVEMYVFPDEYHGKWQPAHRLAVYERAVDWFAFWLRGESDPDPAKRSRYARWRSMRDATLRRKP
ncbi:Atxe2 family lasso peptide isopeptidase [Sphingomonas koreensis]